MGNFRQDSKWFLIGGRTVINKMFFYLFSAKLISRLGDSIYYIVAYWLLWDMTESAKVLSLAGIAMTLSTVFGLVSGVIIDRSNRVVIMISSDLARGLIILFIPLAMYYGFIQWWMIIIVLFLLSIFTQFFNPSEQAVLPEIVGEENISKATGNLFVVEQIALVVGNLLAASLILPIGPSIGFVANSTTYFISIIFILMLYTTSKKRGLNFKPESKGDTNSKSFKRDFIEIWNFIKNTPIVLTCILLFAFLYFSFSPFLVLMSMWADKILNSGALGYSILQTVYPIGMVLGGILTSLVHKKFSYKVIISGALSLAFVFIIIFSLNNYLILAAICILLIGFLVSLTATTIITLQQKIVPNSIRGRYFAISQSIISIALPLGYSFSGIVADSFNIRIVFIGTGICFLIGGAFVLLSDRFKSMELQKNTFLKEGGIKESV
jgi:MFS transporter, DHA3 family, macrolide efflux protein